MKQGNQSLSDYIKKWGAINYLVSVVERYEGIRITFGDDYYTIITHEMKDFHSIEDGINYMKDYGRNHKSKYEIEEEERIRELAKYSVYDEDPIEVWARAQKKPAKEKKSSDTLASVYKKEHPFLASRGLEGIMPLGQGF